MNDPSVKFLRLIQDERDFIEGKLDTFKQCFDLCESPIEQEFLVTWLEVWMPDENYDPNGTPSVANEWQIEQGWLTCLLYPQYRIQAEGHKYRVDFLLRVRLQTTSIEQTFAIELDGHNFHEKTQDQALRDKGRDRVLTRSGITVLRFTGREIYQGAHHVIAEIQSTILGTMFAPTRVVQ